MRTRSVLTLAALFALMIPILAGANRGALAQDATPSVAVGGTPAAVVADPSITGEITVGMVANPQMVALEELVNAGEFAKAYPNITVNLTVLPENEIRQTITQDITQQSGEFDLVTIGPFEVPLWAEQGWLEEVGEDVAGDAAYNVDDFFPSMTAGLTYEDGLYALPFYGESAMTFYRTDLFEAAGLEMPERPTWTQIAEFAAQLHQPDEVYGLCLRGLPGWGEQGAPLTTVINAFGGRWFDEEWNAQLDDEDSAAAIRFYIDNLRAYGPPGVEQNGFTETETLFVQGKCAMWYDATSAAELITDPAENPDFNDVVGFAYPPGEKLPTGSWLWSWNFAMAANSDAKDAALAFAKWATSRQYVDTVVAATGGFGTAPTGARQSLYEDPAYLERAADFADIVLGAINESNPNEPTEEPVPYTGGQFVRIPEFQELGNDVTDIFAGALVGSTEVDAAIAEANELANQVALDNGYQE
ncbi:MAG: Various polyols ABC transporter, substrate-binding protein [uncultured Thermomicrobiales bacterium]|uniref:Various polyols ABC transporter, substrate-binding protein n=1 Tax=uncultured Thermomicrobiales bacterium TaxID=1645740 RepID=A0A6J4UQI0_9BACT|nr:MAG: Various polyols ABC transporter, substrate-binding protein [uncultured Thermomicrobiales bacterium]